MENQRPEDTPFLIPLNMVLFGVSPPAGMDLAVIGHYQMIARKTASPCEPPIQVTSEGDYWRVHDGRHRTIGWIAGGRSLIEAELLT